MSRDTFLLYIPSNRNPNFLLTTLLFFHAALKNEKKLVEKIQIVIAASPSNAKSAEIIVSIFKKNGYLIDLVVGTDYLEKLEMVFKRYSDKEYRYFIKHDDDILIPKNVWKRLLLASPEQLEKKDVLLTTINLSTGIPSWFYFCKTFFSQIEQKKLLQLFKRTKVQTKLWGHNYSKLNIAINSFKMWDENKYWKIMNGLGYHYRGLHPLRMYIRFTYRINKNVLAQFKRFYLWESIISFDTIFDRYLCNNFFVIPYKEYKKIIHTPRLFVDPFDEIPVNRFALEEKKGFSFLKKSVGVHISYNTVYDQTVLYKDVKVSGRDLELLFLKEYFDKLKLELKDDAITELLFWYKEPLSTRLVHFIGKTTRKTPFYSVLSKTYEWFLQKLF